MCRGGEAFPGGAAGLVDVDVSVHDARHHEIVACLINWRAVGNFIERRNGGDYAVRDMNGGGSRLGCVAGEDSFASNDEITRAHACAAVRRNSSSKVWAMRAR